MAVVVLGLEWERRDAVIGGGRPDGSSHAHASTMASLMAGSEPEHTRGALITGAAVRIGRAIALALGDVGVDYRRSSRCPMDDGSRQSRRGFSESAWARSPS